MTNKTFEGIKAGLEDAISVTKNVKSVTGEAEASLFFWLGDGTAEELTEEDFELKIKASRKATDDYLNVR